jgi:hypothetical protein
MDEVKTLSPLSRRRAVEHRTTPRTLAMNRVAWATTGYHRGLATVILGPVDHCDHALQWSPV